MMHVSLRTWQYWERGDYFMGKLEWVEFKNRTQHLIEEES